MVSPPLIIVQLIHLEGPYKGQIQEFTDPEISIGRHPDCKLKFPTDLSIVSRKHASIIREGNRFKLVDSSANGTEINGRKVQETYLKDGDVLTIAPGGPKISFLTQISQEAAQPDFIPPPSPGQQQPPPASEPPRQEYYNSPPSQQPHVPEPPPLPQQQPQPQTPNTFGGSPGQSVKAPLIIQFGPTLRSYKELPVSIGKNPDCEFILDFPGILDRHAQLQFHQSQYWIKDLTGQKLVKVNQRPCEGEVPLQANDVVMLGSQGPVFQFLGGGRLAEMEQQPPKEAAVKPPPRPTAGQEQQESFTDEVLNKAKSIFKKYLDR